MDKRELTAVSVSCVYLVACVWALWDRLDAVLLLAAVSPVAASSMFPKGTNIFVRMLLGAFIDAFLAALAFVPIMGDVIDLGASVVAIVLLAVRFKQFATSLPGGLACLVLYLFLWFEAGFLPHQLSVSGHHPFWFYLVIVIAGALSGGVLLSVLALLLSLMYDGDRAKAVFCTIGFPWYLITFFLTIFLPNRHVKHARQAAEIARRSN